MKNIIPILFLFFPGFSFCQIGTLAIEKQIDSLIDLSRTTTLQGDLEKAKEYNLQAEKLAVDSFGEESKFYSKVCFDRGRSLFMFRDYEGAKKWLDTSKDINEKVLGKESPEGATCLNLLGALHLSLGEFEKGREVTLSAKNIFEANYGEEDIRRLQSLVFLGMLDFRAGEYFSAENNFLEVVFYTKGKEDSNSKMLYLSTLSTLALVYENMNSFEKAELQHIEALKISEELVGKQSIHYADGLNNLGGCYFNAGEFEKAEPIFLEAYEVAKGVLGDTAVDLAYNLNNLGMINLEKGDLEKSASYLSKAEKILIDNDAKERLVYANVATSIVRLNLKKGELDVAAAYIKKAKNIREKITGKYHHEYVDCLILQDELFVAKDNFNGALQNAQEINDINKQRAINASHHLSEFELSNFISKFSNEQSRFFSYSQLYGGGNDALYDNALFYKGYLLSNIGRAERLAKLDSASAELYVELKTLRRNLESEYEKPLEERVDLQSLEAQAEATEKELIRTVAGFSNVIRQVKWEEVREKLEAVEAAIEFVHYRYYSPQLTDSVFYVALLVRSDNEQPEWIPLFEKSELEKIMLANGGNTSEEIADLYSDKMFELIWEPLEPYLAGVKKIHYSPSGLLHRINLPAINRVNGKRLMDKYKMHYVGSTRQLVTGADERKISFSDIVIYGGLEYEMDTIAENELPMAYEGSIKRGGMLEGILDTEVPTRSRVWYGLPKTEEERKKIETLFRKEDKAIVSLSGQAGTEEHFKSLSKGTASPAIIHLATHGFFFPDPKIEKVDQADYLRGGQSNFRFSDDPLFRSGIILSGGNLAWKGGEVPVGREDGILSAYEISNLDLSGTELVVLSACETGLGDIVGSEGVYGLQRAFKKAGADYLIMTLWSIPDSDETVDFMETFYRHLLSRKKVPEAFSLTQKEMRDKYKDPYYWAGFVLVE